MAKPSNLNSSVETLASEQGLLAVMADGIEQLHIDGRSPKKERKSCFSALVR